MSPHALGFVEDETWPLTAERLGFPLTWCVRRAPGRVTAQPQPAPGAGVVAVGARTVGQLEAAVEQLRDAHRAEGRELVRPQEQLVAAVAMAPWSKLAKRRWRRSRSVLAGA